MEASLHALRSAAAGRRHVQAEQTNRLDEIMATVSDEPFFPLIDHDGSGGTTLQLLTDTASVASYYADRHGSYEIVDSRRVAAVTADFYTFRESVATLRPVGEVGGERSDGSDFQVNSAVLFPTGDGGIGGELVWTRFPFGDIVAGRVRPASSVPGPAHLPNERLRVADAHDAYLDAWRAGDADRMAAGLGKDCRWQRRVRWSGETEIRSAAGRDETRAVLATAASGRPPRAIEVLNRVVTEWYVFCDLHLEVDLVLGEGEPRAVTARHIALHPVDDDGRLRAELGDLVVLAPDDPGAP